MGVAAGAFFGALHFGINGMQLLLCFIGSKLISTNSIDAGSMVTVLRKSCNFKGFCEPIAHHDWPCASYGDL